MVTRTSAVAGVPVPAFFYGTAWKEEKTQPLTARALAAGFRAIDTANQRRHYVESGVGTAVTAWQSEAGAGRGDLFLQTKFTYARGQDHRLPYDPQAPPAVQVAQSFASSLEHLGTSYVDSYLLHGPATARGLTQADWELWGAMEELQRAGQARLIGVSNVSLEQLVALHSGAAVKPAFVQNRCYARTGWDREVRAFCDRSGIAYQGFSLLTANQGELAGPVMARMAERTGRTLAQLVFRFALESGIIPLTGTTSADHMREDLACFDFALDGEDRRAIAQLALS